MKGATGRIKRTNAFIKSDPPMDPRSRARLFEAPAAGDDSVGIYASHSARICTKPSQGKKRVADSSKSHPQGKREQFYIKESQARFSGGVRWLLFFR